MIDLDDKDEMPAQKDEAREAQAAVSAGADHAQARADPAAVAKVDAASEYVAAKKQEAGAESQSGKPPPIATGAVSEAGAGGDEGATSYNPMARVSNLKPLPSASSRAEPIAPISPTSEALMFEPPIEAVRKPRSSTVEAPWTAEAKADEPRGAKMAQAPVPQEFGGQAAAATDKKSSDDEPKFYFGIQSEAVSKPVVADRVEEQTFSFEPSQNAKQIPPPIQTEPKSPASSAKSIAPAVETPKSLASSAVISPVGARSSPGVSLQSSPNKAAGGSPGDAPFTPDMGRVPSTAGSVDSGSGGEMRVHASSYVKGRWVGR